MAACLQMTFSMVMQTVPHALFSAPYLSLIQALQTAIGISSNRFASEKMSSGRKPEKYVVIRQIMFHMDQIPNRNPNDIAASIAPLALFEACSLSSCDVQNNKKLKR
jgi:hypothetical protein